MKVVKERGYGLMKWILIVFGIVLFIFSLIQFLKNRNDVESLKIYGLASYVSLAFAILGITLALEPVFIKLPENISSIVPVLIDIVIFVIAARFLIKPGFKKKK